LTATIGHVGIDAAVLIAGNPDKLTLKIGLNACAQLTSHQLCASSIPGVSNILPWYVLSGSYSFGDICGSSSNSSKNNKEEDKDKDKAIRFYFRMKVHSIAILVVDILIKMNVIYISWYIVLYIYIHFRQSPNDACSNNNEISFLE